MPNPPEKPQKRTNPLLDEDFRIAPQPAASRPVPTFVQRHIQAAEEKQDAKAKEPKPQPPRWPMLSGIFLYPFRLCTLASWMFLVLGSTFFGWLFMFWWEYAAIMGASGAYYLGLPVFATALLTFGYAASCSFSIIEATSNGKDEFAASHGMEWKEWIWSFLHLGALALQAGLVGYAIKLVCGSDSWLPMAVGTLAVFPLVLLGALAADAAWVPLAIGKTLQSSFLTGLAWILFYAITTPMIAAWAWLVITQLNGPNPWLVPLYAGPLLATIILIYARLIGRLAGCIAAANEKLLNEGDDDEE
jgi:hypothetical protein